MIFLTAKKSVPLKRVLKKLNNDDNDEINKEFTVSEKNIK